MSVFKLLNPSLRWSLLALFAAGLLFWSSLASLLPTLPLYIQDAGADSQTIGIVMGAFAIGLILSRPRMAKLADGQGRKLVLLIGMVAVAIPPLCYLFTQNIPALIGIRAFHGLSISAFALAYSALVVDLSPPQHRGELIGYMSLVNPLGMAIGPAIGGFLQEASGFSPVFIASAILGGIGLLCVLRIREPDRQQITVDSAQPQQFWRLLLSPRIRIPALVLLLIGLTFGTLSTFVPLFIKEADVSLNVGLFYTAAAMASFAIRLVAGPMSDRYGRGPFMALSLVFYTIAMLLLWTANSASQFLLAGAIEGAGAGTLIPMIAALMADRSYPHERGRTFGLCMVGFDLGIAMAGPILGSVADQIGYRNMFGISAGLAFLALLIFLTFSSKSFWCSLRFALGGRDVYAVAREEG